MYLQLKYGYEAPHDDKKPPVKGGPIFHVWDEHFKIFSDHAQLGPTECLHYFDGWIYYDGMYWTSLDYAAASLSMLSIGQAAMLAAYDKAKAGHPDRVRTTQEMSEFRRKRLSMGNR